MLLTTKFSTLGRLFLFLFYVRTRWGEAFKNEVGLIHSDAAIIERRKRYFGAGRLMGKVYRGQRGYKLIDIESIQARRAEKNKRKEKKSKEKDLFDAGATIFSESVQYAETVKQPTFDNKKSTDFGFLTQTPSLAPLIDLQSLSRGASSKSQSKHNVSIISNSPTIQQPSYSPSNVNSSNPSKRQLLSPSTAPTLHSSFVQSESPSTIPTTQPSIQNSSFPSNNPSVTYSSIPSQIESNYPSNYPSKFPSYFPSQFPSHFPSNYPSTTPSLNPTINYSSLPTTSNFNKTVPPSIPPLQSIKILPFTMLISAESIGLDEEKILQISEAHMTETFKMFIPERLNFESLSLEITQKNWKTRLGKSSHDFLYEYTGTAYFRTFELIDETEYENTVHKARLRAFDSNGMEIFVDLLKNSGLNTSSAFLVTFSDNSHHSQDSLGIGDSMEESSIATREHKTGDSAGITFSQPIQDDSSNPSFFVKVGSISFAIAGVAFIISVVLIYKIVKRMRHNQNGGTTMELDNCTLSQEGLDSRSLPEQNLFTTNHTIYRITEESSFDDEISSRQSSIPSLVC